MAVFLQIILISLSVAMDAISVSIASGMRAQKAVVAHALKIAAFFGIFQAVMPLIGWHIGEVLSGFITAIDHWVAFFLLGFIGVRMIQKAHTRKRREKKDLLDTKTLLLLSIATSIDALIIGITLNLIQLPFIISVTTIGSVTFVLCFLGYLFGKELEALFGKKIEMLGGVVLILIGCKILIEQMIM